VFLEKAIRGVGVVRCDDFFEYIGEKMSIRVKKKERLE